MPLDKGLSEDDLIQLQRSGQDVGAVQLADTKLSDKELKAKKRKQDQDDQDARDRDSQRFRDLSSQVGVLIKQEKQRLRA